MTTSHRQGCGSQPHMTEHHLIVACTCIHQCAPTRVTCIRYMPTAIALLFLPIQEIMSACTQPQPHRHTTHLWVLQPLADIPYARVTPVHFAVIHPSNVIAPCPFSFLHPYLPNPLGNLAVHGVRAPPWCMYNWKLVRTTKCTTESERMHLVTAGNSATTTATGKYIFSFI